jgi:hypothetical protein
VIDSDSRSHGGAFYLTGGACLVNASRIANSIATVVHFPVILESIEALKSRLNLADDEIFLWVDYFSIPQLT